MKENMIKIIKDGVEKEVEVLLVFKLEDTNKDYIIFTEGETDGDLQIVNASVLIETDAGFTLDKIETDEEWAKVKDVMRQVIKDEE